MNQKQDPSYNSQLSQYFDDLAPKRGYWIKKNRYYYDDQKRYLQFLIPENSTVLELGCGLGDLLASVNPKRGVGLDISPRMVELARKRHPGLEFHSADGDHIEGWGETFDFVILSDVVGHLHDVQETLTRLRAFCRPQTRIIISYYNFLWEPILKFGERIGAKMPQKHQNWLSTADIANLLELADYQVVKTDTRLLCPKRIPWLGPLANRYIGSLPIIRHMNLCQYIVARPLNLQEEKEYSTTILIPCRNERGNIAAAIERLPAFGGHHEVIFVDGHSTDGTREEIRRVMAENPDRDISLLVQSKTGKGNAVREGFAKAKGDILMILDADLTVPPEDLPKFYDAIAADRGEFINGCRLVYPMEKQAMRFLNLLGNKFFSMMFTWILNQRFKDTLCGTKVLLRQDYLKIQANRSYFGDFDPFGDFDLIFGAVKQNLKVTEIPIRYRERTYGSTNISRFRHGWLLLQMTFFSYRKIKAI